MTFDLGKDAKLEMLPIPAGEFQMGSSDSDAYATPSEKPRHRVRITRPFHLGKYPITQQQWEAVMGTNPSRFKFAENPVESVNWNDCQEFLKKLNAMKRSAITRALGPAAQFRLPTDAQWEYACRAGSTTQFSFGDDAALLGEYAWYGANSGSYMHPVGAKKPNAWGLYDMHGNARQWCADWFDFHYYEHSPTDDPTGPASSLRPQRDPWRPAMARPSTAAIRRVAPQTESHRSAPIISGCGSPWNR